MNNCKTVAAVEFEPVVILAAVPPPDFWTLNASVPEPVNVKREAIDDSPVDVAVSNPVVVVPEAWIDPVTKVDEAVVPILFFKENSGVVPFDFKSKLSPVVVY